MLYEVSVSKKIVVVEQRQKGEGRDRVELVQLLVDV